MVIAPTHNVVIDSLNFFQIAQQEKNMSVTYVEWWGSRENLKVESRQWKLAVYSESRQ